MYLKCKFVFDVVVIASKNEVLVPHVWKESWDCTRLLSFKPVTCWRNYYCRWKLHVNLYRSEWPAGPLRMIFITCGHGFFVQRSKLFSQFTLLYRHTIYLFFFFFYASTEKAARISTWTLQLNLIRGETCSGCYINLEKKCAAVLFRNNATKRSCKN